MSMHKNINRINRALLVCLLVVFFLLSVAGCSSKAEKAEGSAESSFRKQMANASVTEVTVKQDLVLESPVEVSGTKILIGEGSVTAIGEWAEDNYMFVVPSGSQLTVKGSVTINAAERTSGIRVAQGAIFTLEENAVVKNASARGSNIYNLGQTLINGGEITGGGDRSAGIYSEGTLTQNGGVISGAYNNVVVQSGSFSWNGGTNQNSSRDGIFVAESAELTVTSKNAVLSGSGVRGIYLHGKAVISNITLNTSGDSLIKISSTGDLELNGGTLTDAGYHALEHAGNLLMNGGSIRNSFSCGIVNTGVLEITGGNILDNTATKGILNKHAGQAKITSETVMLSDNKSAIGNEDTSYFELSSEQLLLGSATNL